MYLQKLTDLVCQEKNIEKDLKELKFGCKLKSKINGNELFLIKNNYIEYDTTEGIYNNTNVEIIGNPLEERHLRMYCKNKGIKNIFTNTDGKIFNGGNGIAICELDNKKPLSQQSEEVLKNIFEALSS